MFGWEFPPHISGGLGTACYGLTRALAARGDVEVTFVVPRLWGDEVSEGLRLLGAGQVPVVPAGWAPLVSASGKSRELPEARDPREAAAGPELRQAPAGPGPGEAAAGPEPTMASEDPDPGQEHLPPDLPQHEQATDDTFISAMPDAPLPGGEVEFRTIASELVPYVTPEEFWKLKSRRYEGESRFVEVRDDGTIGFGGGYGGDLFREIRHYAVAAERIAAGHGYDLIHAHDWLAFPAGVAASRILGKPLVVHVHATEYDRGGGAVNPAVYAVEREGMETAVKVIAVSNLTRRTVIGRYGIDPEKVVTIHNAVEPWGGLPAEPQPKGRRDRIVTFLGRITSQKGPEYFVEAAALVLARVKGVRFVMAGSGDRMGDMVEYAARLGIADRFHFTGFLEGDEVQRMLQISDVFVMPSVSEPFGIAPLEALQAGVPVVVSRQSGVAEVLQYAVKVDFWDTHAIADAIYGFLHYPALAHLFAGRGGGEAGALRWDKAAGEVAALYRELTAGDLSPETAAP